jgi:hypothetical protein
MVKLPRYETNYLVVYETRKMNGLAPHFFIYDIMSRSITRRFLPLSPDFEINWKNEPVFEVYKEGATSEKSAEQEDN